MKLSVKKVFFVIFIFSFFSKNYAQTVQSEKQAALSYEFSYIGEMVYNTRGGIKTGLKYLGMANIGLSFDIEKAGLWKGGEFYINAANTHGGEPSSDLVGDFQGITNIEAGNLNYLHELWFKQRIKNVSLIVGLQDLNAEYAASDFGGFYINSSFGIHSTIADNVPSPIFPLTRLGAMVLWDINDNFTAKAAVYDGLRHDYEDNDYNLNWSVQTDGGILYIAEFQHNANLFERLPASYKIGFYNHYHNPKASSNYTSNHNNSGFYLVADQTIYSHANRDGGLGFFIQLGLSSAKQNNHFAYVGGGFNYRGISKKRADDEIGLAIAHSHFKTTATGNETAIELSYKAKMGKYIFIQPDIQYIINPSGTDFTLNNAFVAILRLSIDL